MIKWDDIQEYYDKGYSVRDTLLKFNISGRKFYKGVNCGFVRLRNKSESQKISQNRNPRKHSDETKKKISEIRKKYLSENPDMVPYRLNHSSKESFPEKYFSEVFENENIKVERYFQVGLYELDFCIPDKKIDIEIDGNQHYYDDKIVESDKRRTLSLEESGWDIIRINWSDYQKMNLVDRKDYILKLKMYIGRLIDSKPLIKIEKKVNKKEKKVRIKKIYYCKHCNEKCSYKKERCESCFRIQSRKIERPRLDLLLKEVGEFGYSKTGRKYGVSDNSIRKWIGIKKDDHQWKKRLTSKESKTENFTCGCSYNRLGSGPQIGEVAQW